MDLGIAFYPFTQLRIFGHGLISQSNCRFVIVVIIFAQILDIPFIDKRRKAWEKPYKAAHDKLYLITHKEHGRAWRIYIYTLFLKVCCKLFYILIVSESSEQESNLVIVRNFTGILELSDKMVDIFLPAARAPVAFKGYYGRRFSYSIFMCSDFFIKAAVSPLKAEAIARGCMHPAVIEPNYIRVGAVVFFKENTLTFILIMLKVSRKLKYITDCCASEAVHTLVIITDYAEILFFICKGKDYLLLDIVSILILIHHDIFYLATDFIKHFAMVFQHFIALGLYAGKINTVILFKNLPVFFGNLCMHSDIFVCIISQSIKINRFFLKLIGYFYNLRCLLPVVGILSPDKELFKPCYFLFKFRYLT